MLELRALSKRLGSFTLDGIDLSLNRGEYFVLLGPSGAGKTVLLELVAGILAPDAGAILYEGKEITSLPPEERGFSLLYQDYALFPHMTVIRNIAYGLVARGIRTGDAEDSARSLARRLGIETLLDRSPGTLSGGEQQRVALARALLPQPSLLLLDEPLAALDTTMRISLRKELKRVQRETGAAFLHVTHDPEEALYLGDRMGVILERRIQQVGTPEELFRRPSDPAVGSFLGMKNFMTVDSARPGVCELRGLEIHASAADETVTHLWIKPEELILSASPFSSSARNQFPGTVAEIEPAGMLFAVVVAVGRLHLTALVTHESLQALDLEISREVFCTFKSSAVHCF